MTAAIEITTFKLVHPATMKDFIATNADVDAWLLRQPGFSTRKIAQRDDGVIVDMLIWDAVENAVDAMHRLMDELRHSPVHAVIDQSTVSWSVATVGHSISIGESS